MLPAKFVTLFVFAGGFAGGVTACLMLGSWSVWLTLANGDINASWPLSAVPSFVAALPLTLLVSALGALIGLPSAWLTGLFYAQGAYSRNYAAISAFGAISSALWGAGVARMISGVLNETSIGVILFFAGCGFVASLVCHSFAKRMLAREAQA